MNSILKEVSISRRDIFSAPSFLLSRFIEQPQVDPPNLLEIIEGQQEQIDALGIRVSELEAVSNNRFGETMVWRDPEGIYPYVIKYVRVENVGLDNLSHFPHNVIANISVDGKTNKVVTPAHMLAVASPDMWVTHRDLPGVSGGEPVMDYSLYKYADDNKFTNSEPPYFFHFFDPQYAPIFILDPKDDLTENDYEIYYSGSLSPNGSFEYLIRRFHSKDDRGVRFIFKHNAMETFDVGNEIVHIRMLDEVLSGPNRNTNLQLRYAYRPLENGLKVLDSIMMNSLTS